MKKRIISFLSFFVIGTIYAVLARYYVINQAINFRTIIETGLPVGCLLAMIYALVLISNKVLTYDVKTQNIWLKIILLLTNIIYFVLLFTGMYMISMKYTIIFNNVIWFDVFLSLIVIIKAGLDTK